MSTVEQIEHAIEHLPPEDFDRVASWIDGRRHEAWKQQMDRDAAGGKLDFLFDEAGTERAAGQLRDWPDKAR